MFRFRDKEVADRIVSRLSEMELDITLMHVCGGHQDTFIRYGIDSLIEGLGVDIRQGPGCPVCVTPQEEIEEVMLLARKGRTITVFGDMMRVPGEKYTLFDMQGKGADVRMVYSIDDSVRIARENPDLEIVFMAIGFETTAPSTAAVLAGNEELPGNFSVLCTHRVVPPALKGIVEMGELKLDGLIEPGHVSTIIGSEPYEFLSRDYHVPQVITGFEPLDLLMAVYQLALQIKRGEAKLYNGYGRAVDSGGNKKALALMEQAFEVCDVGWRGFGIIPMSGFRLSERYEMYDARKKFEDDLRELAGKKFPEPKGCRCGEVLRGVIYSHECPLFGKVCTPQNPIGPCMVTSEGSCNIMLKYGRYGNKE